MLSVAAVAVTDSNEANLGTMRGRIVDNSNQVLPGATVMIENLHTGVVSDANGFYTIPNLKPGVYTVKVSYVGYQPTTAKLTISAEKTEVKDFVLSEEWSLRALR